MFVENFHDDSNAFSILFFFLFLPFLRWFGNFLSGSWPSRGLEVSEFMNNEGENNFRRFRLKGSLSGHVNPGRSSWMSQEREIEGAAGSIL